MAHVSCGRDPGLPEAAMSHDPASKTALIMLRRLQMHGMAQAVADLTRQGTLPFEE